MREKEKTYTMKVSYVLHCERGKSLSKRERRAGSERVSNKTRSEGRQARTHDGRIFCHTGTDKSSNKSTKRTRELWSLTASFRFLSTGGLSSLAKSTSKAESQRRQGPEDKAKPPRSLTSCAQPKGASQRSLDCPCNHTKEKNGAGCTRQAEKGRATVSDR